MLIPKGVLYWLLISNIIVCFDGFFILNRPETMQGGKYYFIYKPYEYYYTLDTLYANQENQFVIIISWLNLCEAFLTFVGLFFFISKCQIKKVVGAVVCLSSSVMVFWKTVIYMWYDYDWLTQEGQGINLKSILCYYLPNSFWLAFPLYSTYIIGKNLVSKVQSKRIQNQKQKRI